MILEKKKSNLDSAYTVMDYQYLPANHENEHEVVLNVH